MTSRHPDDHRPLAPPPDAPAALAHPDREDAPLVLMELIHRLKVRDVMTREVITETRQAPLRRVQAIMKEKRLSGVPVVDRGRLYGLVSIDDIIRALEGGYIDEPCSKHMSSRLIVLEDDMPLAFAIRYFDRYRYGRFPVLNRDQKLVGIVSQRDINRALVLELSREVNRLETRPGAHPDEPHTNVYMLREFAVRKFDLEHAGKAANQIRLWLTERNVEPKIIRRIAVAAYELEINLCVHSEGGTLSFLINQGRVTVTARDAGPGIADVEWACRDGTSTASDWVRSLGFGAGLGLPNVRRVSDDFHIESSAGGGTTVRAVIHLQYVPAPGDAAGKGAQHDH